MPKVTDLSSLASFDGDETIYVVDDDDGTPTSKKATIETLAAYVGGGGGLLAVVQYNPGSQTVISTSSSSFADLDATNIAVTFTAPSTGKVLVTANAPNVDVTITGDGDRYLYNLRDSGGNIADTSRTVCRPLTSTSGQANGVSSQWLRTGLTPGASYTYKIGHRTMYTTGTAQGRTILGNDSGSYWGAFTITVETAPA